MDDYILVDGELYHYGVKGMKWGVRKKQDRKQMNTLVAEKSLTESLLSGIKKGRADTEKKVAKYELKSAKAHRKSEKLHATKDLGRMARVTKKAEKYNVKSAKLAKKAQKIDDVDEQLKLNRKSAKYAYKSSKYRIKSNRLQKQSGYGRRAMRYSIKSDKYAKKAAKGRMYISTYNLNERTWTKHLSEVNKQIEIGSKYIDMTTKD